MPIEVERMERGVYRAIWTGSITTEDIILKMAVTRDLVSQSQDARYCLIIDLTEVGHIPVSITPLRAVATSDDRLAGFLVVRPPAVASMIAKVLRDLTRVRFETFSLLEDAVIRARQLNEEEPTLTSSRKAGR
jgi:hypothetical protein